MSLGRILQREVRVATSRRAQPIWFRIVKWVVFGAIIWWLWRSPYFWWWIGGGFVAGVGIHLIWRSKTKGWTQPWYGWDDVDTADRNEPPH